jgi:hypothetical protein
MKAYYDGTIVVVIIVIAVTSVSGSTARQRSEHHS